MLSNTCSGTSCAPLQLNRFIPVEVHPMRLPLSALLAVCLYLTCLPAAAQESGAASAGVAASSVVPRVINYSDVLKDASGRTLTSITGVTFLLYSSEHSGAPLWLETQTVMPDKTGHYTAQLGATSAKGLPSDLFVWGEARWLAVQIGNEAEQPRVLLVAVPYAMKAVDAQTLGGLPPSAFVLAAPPVSGTPTANASPASSAAPGAASSAPPPAVGVSTSGSASNVGTIALFSTATDIEKSIVTQTGTTAINVLGKLNLPATGTATASAGFNSRPQSFVASAFSSATSAAVAQTFQWQAEPVNNNTASASGTLNLLHATGTAAASETGLKISGKGILTFAPGQTFPGTGTVSSVGLSAPAADFTVTGSPVTSSGTLNLAWKVAPTNVDTANAIVKRDGTGSFNVTSITGSGTFATATANPTAIQGSSSRNGGIGVHGSATAASGTLATAGVLGDVVSTKFLSSGVLGNDGNTSGNGGVTLGVQGHSQNPFGIGVLGFNGINGLSQRFQVTAGSQRIGVWGDAEGGSSELFAIGVVGKSDTGVAMFAENGPGGCCAAIVALGGTSANAQGATGLPGIASNGGSGDPNSVTNGGDGVIANGGNGGPCNNTNACGSGGAGITATGGSAADVNLHGGPGPGGRFTGGDSSGCSGDCGGDGIFAIPGNNPNSGQTTGFAGNFQGDIIVTGGISAGTKDFKIDHPLDPANKYLVHSSVESSEMMNIYTGNVTTDTRGEVIVRLPEWFEVLNSDFRYQLTVIGQFAQAIVAQEIENHEFTIRTSAPNVKVSWQVTGVRQDAFAKAHPLVVEEEKSARRRGFYIHPELYGQPKEKQIEWARHPLLMKRAAEGSTRLVGLGKEKAR
jgi:trimeric autotransporter adhesin